MQPPADKRTSIPALLLEQWRLGELPKPQQEALLQEFGDAAIQEALARVAADESRYRPPQISWPSSKHKQEQRFTSQTALPWLLAASLLLVVFASRPWQPEAPKADNILLKGDVQPLQAYRKVGDQVLKVQDGELLHEGDLIQLAYEAGPFQYGAIVSIDGKAHITWFFPGPPDGDGRLQQGQRVLLKEAYKLDNAPNFEKFVLVRSQQPIDRTRLEAKLQELFKQQNPGLDDAAWDLYVFSIRK